ncbi:MAG: hypothetical protein HY906_06840 [Deltaproteobacteria bacterium]|nr:hypothetical protein [Deltaproteobacteria bacterium]
MRATLAILALLLPLAVGHRAVAAPPAGPHLDRRLVASRCAACHAGHGRAKSRMLRDAVQDLCFRCHGASAAREKARKAGTLTQLARPADIERDFQKPYRHPIERSDLHRADERLPERSGKVLRHAACADCHEPHVPPPRQGESLLGLRPRQAPIRGVTTEAELCFRCHGAVGNRAARSSDLGRRFAATARSVHAVLAPAFPGPMPSLIRPWTSSSILSCGQCHGSDDPGGPRGPHGSRIPHLLRYRFETADGTPEGEAQYALCYRCHSRKSILGNESFRYHNRHLVTASRGRAPATCRACHSPHGSAVNPRLIDFDTTVVLPDRFGRIAYLPVGAPAGHCRLSCHGVEHPRASALRDWGEVVSPRLPVAPGVPPPAGPMVGPKTPIPGSSLQRPHGR